MLASSPAANGESELRPYLRAGFLSGLPEELPKMWAPTGPLAEEVRSGDLLVAEGGDVGRAEWCPDVPEGTVIQNSLHRVVPAPEWDSSFVKYALMAIHGGDWLEVLCNKATFGHLTVGKLRSLPIPVQPLERQRLIAAFLDSDMGRVDDLIAAKARMVQLTEERQRAQTQNALTGRGVKFPVDASREAIEVPPGWHVTTLVRCLRQLTNGYVGPTRDVLVDDGVRYIQGLHIKGGAIDFDRRPFYVPKDWHDAHPRIHLGEGDVLIVQTGDIGQVAVVPPGFGPASCHALQMLRVEPRIVSGEFLGLYLQIPFGKDSLLARATGALHPHLEGGIRDVPVVVPPSTTQKELVAEAQRARSIARDTVHTLQRQIDLLRERRQSLIVAAVTGELEVA